MKVTKDNISELPKEEQERVLSIMLDLDYVNKKLSEKDNEIYIEWQDWHNEYSEERVDPCPDYYGYYFLMTNLKNEDGYAEMVGFEMTIDDLDYTVGTLVDFTEFFM